MTTAHDVLRAFSSQLETMRLGDDLICRLPGKFSTRRSLRRIDTSIRMRVMNKNPLIVKPMEMTRSWLWCGEYIEHTRKLA